MLSAAAGTSTLSCDLLYLPIKREKHKTKQKGEYEDAPDVPAGVMAAAHRDPGGTGSALPQAAPTGARLPKITFLPPKAFVHPLQVHFAGGWWPTGSAGSPSAGWAARGQGCIKSLVAAWALSHPEAS